MADFCKQCNKEMFNMDTADFSPPEGGVLEEGYGWQMLCETCGPIIVDNDGKCIAKWCEVHGEENGRTDTNG